MSSQTDKLKIAIYARVSSKKKVAYLEHQIEKCKQMIELKGGDLYKIYVNKKGVSGETHANEREEYLQLCDDFAKGHFNAVVFYSYDRLGTSARIIFTILENFKRSGIIYMSCKEYVDDSPRGEMSMQQTCFSIEYAKKRRAEKKLIKKNFKNLKKKANK